MNRNFSFLAIREILAIPYVHISHYIVCDKLFSCSALEYSFTLSSFSIANMNIYTPLD